MKNLEKLIKEIMVEAEKDGEPVTYEEAKEMAEMELGASEIKTYNHSTEEKKPRTRKEDTAKIEIVNQIFAIVSEKFADAEIKNKQGEIIFTHNGENFSLNLVRHRAKKS